MKLEIYGSDEEGWSAHGEYEPGVDPALRPCPFCGCTDGLTVENTHTPHYSVECESCEATGPSNEDSGTPIFSKRGASTAHKLAFRSAIDLWNKRAGDWHGDD